MQTEVMAGSGVSSSEIQIAFDAVSSAVRASSAALSNEQMLELYGLFKQATHGDVTTSRPGMFDPRGRAKWDAWKARSGMTREDAMVTYIRVARDMGLV